MVTISKFSGTGPTTPSVTFTRQPGARINTTDAYADVNVTPAWTGDPALMPGARIVQVDVTYQWNSVFGGRARSETSSTIISDGTKK